MVVTVSDGVEAGVALGGLGVGVAITVGMGGVAVGFGEAASFGVGLALAAGVALGLTVGVGLGLAVGVVAGFREGVAPGFTADFGEAAGLGVAFSVRSTPKSLRKNPKNPPDLFFTTGVGEGDGVLTTSARRTVAVPFSGRAVWGCWGVLPGRAGELSGLTVIWASTGVAQNASTRKNLFMGSGKKNP